MVEVIDKYNKEEEKEFDTMRSLGIKHHIPFVESHVEYEVAVGKDILYRSKGRAHSFVRNLYNIVAMQSMALNSNRDPNGTGAFGPGTTRTKNTDGVTQSIDGAVGFCMLSNNLDAVNFGYLGNVSRDDRGIIIGTGVGAESFEDYSLGTQIADGIGAGQVVYNIMVAPTVTYAALLWTVVYSRYFNNNSGGIIAVDESGIMGYYNGNCIIVSRDLTGGINLPDTGQFKVVYTFTMTYPS